MGPEVSFWSEEDKAEGEDDGSDDNGMSVTGGNALSLELKMRIAEEEEEEETGDTELSLALTTRIEKKTKN